MRLTYNSCRNRHCPKCQTLTKERWLVARRADLLPIPYFHVVFTLPHAFNALAQGNPRVMYTLLFRAAADTLLTFGRDPRHLGGTIGITAVLHTWGQTLAQHQFEARLYDKSDSTFLRLTIRGSTTKGVTTARVRVEESDVEDFEVSGRLRHLCWPKERGRDVLLLSDGTQVIGLVHELSASVPCTPA